MGSFLLRAKMLWGLRTYAARLASLFLDRRVSPALKVLTGVGALLVVSPINILGDLPVIGVVDDAVLLMLIALLFVRLCPPDVVAEYWGRARESRLKNVTPT